MSAGQHRSKTAKGHRCVQGGSLAQKLSQIHTLRRFEACETRSQDDSGVLCHYFSFFIVSLCFLDVDGFSCIVIAESHKARDKVESAGLSKWKKSAVGAVGAVGIPHTHSIRFNPIQSDSIRLHQQFPSQRKNPSKRNVARHLYHPRSRRPSFNQIIQNDNCAMKSEMIKKGQQNMFVNHLQTEHEHW